jgi:hypothetical protein
VKHKKDCECPIHIQEDTTNVKYAAFIVVVLLSLVFLLSGCSYGKGTVDEGTGLVRSENNEVICYRTRYDETGLFCHWKGEK